MEVYFYLRSYYTLIREGHVRIDVLYANLSKKNKAKDKFIWKSNFRYSSYVLTIFFRGMSCKQCVLNQPIMNFETSQSTQGMNIKYLMAGFLIIFALTMLIQFTVYILRSYKIIKEEVNMEFFFLFLINLYNGVCTFLRISLLLLLYLALQ